jgi:transcriptional regulator
MSKEDKDKIALKQGTLDMLVLRTLLAGPTHGHAIAKHIQRTSDDVLQVEHGSLYPAIHRLEKKGLISSAWKNSKEHGRELKLYSLTAAGRQQLLVEENKWKQLARAIAKVMRPA